MDKFDTLFYKIAVLILFLITLLLNVNIELLKKDVKELRAEIEKDKSTELEFKIDFKNIDENITKFILQNLNEKSSD